METLGNTTTAEGAVAERRTAVENTPAAAEENKAAVMAVAALREPESEDSHAAASSSSVLSVVDGGAENSDVEVKREATEVNDGDVEMECDEAAEELETGDSGEEEEEEEVGMGVGMGVDVGEQRRGVFHGARVVDAAAPVREYPEEYAKYQIPEKDAAEFAAGLLASPLWGSKRKRSDAEAADVRGGGRVMVDGIDLGRPLPVATKRKGSSDFLRKGQWTPTEERLAKLLIEAFEEGYLPIYTGIRLRGYLAVQLQCDPMRVSKKLCAGTIDGKKIPKNYGQKKFRLRKKLLWDREEAGRILATLERLTKELWAETGLAPPQYLTLSTTRNAEDEAAAAAVAPSSPVKKLSPPANKSKKQKNGVVFPIIYLNLSKKLKQGQSGGASSVSASFMYDNVIRHYGIDTPYVQNPDGTIQVVGYASNLNDSDASSSSGSEGGPQPVKVDGESLQAAYELLHLHHHCTSPSGSATSRSSTPTPSAAADADHQVHHSHQRQQPTQSKEESKPATAAATATTVLQATGIGPAPTAKPAILRQQAPPVSS